LAVIPPTYGSICTAPGFGSIIVLAVNAFECQNHLRAEQSAAPATRFPAHFLRLRTAIGEDLVPTYQYACTECGHRFEAVQSFTDDSLTTCPVCGGQLRKVYGSVGVVFKGSGFYRTDSRAASSATAPAGSSSDKPSGEKSGGEKGGGEKSGGEKSGGEKKAAASSGDSGSSSASKPATAGSSSGSGSGGGSTSGSSGGN
jgi:putative FmdB family regulatory protein